jgi:hypothetical protein
MGSCLLAGLVFSLFRSDLIMGIDACGFGSSSGGPDPLVGLSVWFHHAGLTVFGLWECFLTTFYVYNSTVAVGIAILSHD